MRVFFFAPRTPGSIVAAANQPTPTNQPRKSTGARRVALHAVRTDCWHWCLSYVISCLAHSQCTRGSALFGPVAVHTRLSPNLETPFLRPPYFPRSIEFDALKTKSHKLKLKPAIFEGPSVLLQDRQHKRISGILPLISLLLIFSWVIYATGSESTVVLSS